MSRTVELEIKHKALLIINAADMSQQLFRRDIMSNSIFCAFYYEWIMSKPK